MCTIHAYLLLFEIIIVEPRPKLVTLDTSVLLYKSHKDPFLDNSGGPWSSGRLRREKLRQMSDERRCDGSPVAGTSTQSDGGENLCCFCVWSCGLVSLQHWQDSVFLKVCQCSPWRSCSLCITCMCDYPPTCTGVSLLKGFLLLNNISCVLWCRLGTKQKFRETRSGGFVWHNLSQEAWSICPFSTTAAGPININLWICSEHVTST